MKLIVEENGNCIAFEVFTTMTMKSVAFWVVIPHSSERARHVKGACCLHIKGQKGREARSLIE
jgi:hypothetical protein